MEKSVSQSFMLNNLVNVRVSFLFFINQLLEDYRNLMYWDCAWLAPSQCSRVSRNRESYGIKRGLPGSLDICQMLLLHNQATSADSVIIGRSYTSRFAHVWGRPHKTDKAEDIGPNIVPVCVFVIMRGRWRKAQTEVKRWGGGDRCSYEC